MQMRSGWQNSYFQLRPLLHLTLIVFLVSACSQSKPARVLTIGVVNTEKNLVPVLAAFKTSLTALGYAEGKAVTYQSADLVSTANTLTADVKKLVDTKVDLVLALGTDATKAAHDGTANTNLPVLFLLADDPVQSGIVDSLKEPGGNVTGIATTPDYYPQRLEWLTRLAPDTQCVFVPYTSGVPGDAVIIPILQSAADKLGIEIVAEEVRDETINSTLDKIPPNIDSIFLLTDDLINTQLTDIVKVAMARKLPLSVHFKSQVASGALYSFGYDPINVGKQAARLAVQIFKGVKPATLPIDLAENGLTVNPKTAKALGITISEEALKQATPVAPATAAATASAK